MRRDACHFEDAIAEDTLIGQVMNGVDRGGIGKEGIIAIDSMHPVRNDARVPVVTVNDVWRPVQSSHRFERGPAKEDETLTIIGIAIDVLAIKIARGVDHVDRYALTYAALAYTHRVAEIRH